MLEVFDGRAGASRQSSAAARRSLSGSTSMPVPLDIAVLAADDEHHELLGLARVRDLARRLRLDVQQPALAELAHLAADLHARPAAMDEVELVLLVVEVLEALEARRIDDPVDAERRHAERAAHLTEPRPVPELVQRPESRIRS